MANFSQLSHTLKTLHEESNINNQLLPLFEDKLNRVCPNLLAWVENAPLQAHHWKDAEDRKGRTLTVLGFGKYGEKPQLLVKTTEELFEGDEADNGSQRGKVLYQMEQPLLESSQDTRIAALGRIPDLLEIIKEDAEQKIHTMRQGRQIVEEVLAEDITWLPGHDEETNGKLNVEQPVG